MAHIESQSNDKRANQHADIEQLSQNSDEKNDILQLEHTDPVLNAKMHLVNNVS
jgi:hypothetical protein